MIITQYQIITLFPFYRQFLKYLKNNLSTNIFLFSKKNLFNSSQNGFRVGHSTELAAIEIVDRVIQNLDDNETPINIYLDLSKAFDTLDH